MTAPTQQPTHVQVIEGFRCRHCGARQAIPESTPVDVLFEVLAAFISAHRGCPEVRR